MNSLQYFKATEADAKTAAELRIEFLLDMWSAQPEEKINVLRKELENYFSKALKERSYVCWIAKTESQIVGVGGMVIREQPGNLKNPSGKMAYIMNMYTVPAFRKKGIASTLLQKLMSSAKEMGIDMFELHSTEDGAPVYEKNGFQLHGQPTYRKYGHT